MAFFRQLGLLLWKNGLSAFRQPLWSLTLLAWPLITFLIILVTRHQFPPVLKETCYVSPRNLPSAGFFPFLQTLMCDADSRCRNTSSLVDPTDSKTSANTRSLLVQRSAPLVNLLRGDGFFNFPFQNESRIDHAQMATILNNVFGSTFQDGINNISLGNDNATFLGDQETMNNIVSSVNQVKRSICTVTLPMMNTTSSDPLNYAMVNFCKSNSSVFEVSLLTLNQILTNLMLTKPNETVTAAEMSASMFDQLQNHSSLWDSLLQVPQLFSSSSDQVLNDTKLLLSNLQRAMNVIQNTFPTVNDSLSSVHPLLVGGINTVHYVQNWPGKGVSIPLSEIVTLQNDSLSTMMKAVLQEVQIPLHKAIGLALDKNLVHSYLCDNSSKSLLLTAACTTGTINMALGWISPDMVAKQALLAWSKDVAPHDVSFIKGMLQSLIGGSSPGGHANSNSARKRRSIDTQPQSVEEELFLSIGEVVMEILQIVPEVDVVVQNILRTGFQSMRTATQALNTVAEIMANGLKDANQLQLTYLTLTTNETQASIWIDQVLDSVIRIAIKTLESGSLTCEDLLGPFEWLLNTESIKTPVWESMICQNSTLQQALLADWQPLVQEIQELYNTVTGQADFNVTLPIILAEWQKLANSSLQFQMLFERLTTELDGEYWMNWMLDNSTFYVHDTFLQSLGLFVETFGENIETSEVWPEVKNYFHMVYWILDYMPGTTTHAANCSVNNTLAIHCDTGLNWPHFTEVVHAALLSPNKALVNSLEGTVNLLQHVYADVYKNLTASVLKQELEDEDALSTYLGNLTHDLDGFLQNISILPYSNISNPDIMFLLLQNLLEPTGLSPLLTLFLSDAPGNVSTVLDVASKLGRIYQPMVTSNETDPTTRDLEQLIMRFLYSEDNLTLPISHVMGYNLLNYSEHFSLDDVISLTKAIQPFTNQSSPGLVETILSAIQLWKTVMDSPNNDPANITLAYIHQLRELAKSLLRLQNTESFEFPIEQLTITQVNQISEDIINFLSPESLKTLTENGPDAALSIVIQKFLEFLPLEVQQGASPLFQDFRDIGSIFSECAKDQNCSMQVSEIFSFLNEIVDMMSLANANITHEMLSNNSMLYEYEKVRSMLFSLILSQIDETNMTLNHTLQFIGMIMDTPNISVSEIQNALEQSNLTLEELKNIAELAQAVNISKLLDDVMAICNARQCLETEKDSAVTAKCVMGLIDGISSFLRQLPSYHNETTILLQIPLLINKTIGDMIQVNFSSSPNMALKQTLYSNLANIKLNLQLNQLNTPEIMMELEEVEELIQLFANTEESFNSTLMMDPIDAQKVYLEIMEWYLEKMENITSNSSFSELIHPFFYITQMQITLQLAQTDFALYVSNQYKLLMNSLQYPLDNAGVSKIGETVVEVLQHLFDLIPFDLEVQNATLHSEMFNTTILNATEHQIKQCLDMMQKWMIQPNVSLALTSLLNWGNSSMNVSTHATDIQQLLKSLDNFDLDQVAYLSAINNITQSLRNALTVAELSGGLQSDDFSDAILDAVQSVMQIWTEDTEDLPVSTQKDILDFVRDSLKLIVQPDVSFASSRDISLLILKTAENVIQHTAPDMFSDYIMYGLKVVTTFFESAPTADMAGDWSEMISNEMKIAVSFLPPNSTAQAYASALINVTYSVLESHLGNMSVWSSFENATEENVSLILDQMSKALSMLWPLVMDGPGSFGIKAPSLESFDDLASVLEMVMTGKADEDTWENLEEMLESLLSTLEGTEQWGNISSAIPHFETIIGTLLNIEQAENEMILSLQMPVLTLMGEVAQSANNTHLNLSDISERMQLAVQSMANGTSECGEVLKEWEPVREAAGLSHAAMAMWCNVSLQPLLEALTAAQTVFSRLNMSDMDVGPANGSDAAERIVNTVQSLYQVSVNQRLVTLQLIRAVSDQLAMLASQPLSPEAQQHLQDTKFLDSLSSINFQLPDEVLNMGPFIIPYIKAMEKALDYTLNNYFIIQNRSTSDERFEEAEMIYLTTVNTTLDNMLSLIGGNLTGLNESTITDTARKAFKLLKHWQVFSDDPMIYQTLKQFLESNDKRVILQKVADISTWLASVEPNMTSDIFSMIFGKWPGLNETSFTNLMRDTVRLLSDHEIFGDEPMIYQALEQFLESNDTRVTLQKVSEITAWFASREENMTSDNIFSMIWGNWSRFNQTSFVTMTRDTLTLLSDQEMFGDEPMIYQALEQFLEFNDKTVILQKVAEITRWLSFIESNLTLDNTSTTIWGNWSGLNETSFTNMMREAVKLLSDQKILGDDPMIYEALEQFVASSDKRMILQNVSKITALLASVEANMTSDNIFSMVWGNWSRLNETSFANMMSDALKLLSDHKIFGDEPMFYQTLEQLLEANDKMEILTELAEITAWLASTETNITSGNISMIWGNWSGLNETSFANMMSDALKLLSDQKIFGDEPMIYQILEQVLLSNDKRMILTELAEFTAWLASVEANMTSDIFSRILGNWSRLNETYFINTMREAVKLLSDQKIFGEEPMIYQILEQFVSSSDKSMVLQKVSEITALLASFEANMTSDNIFSTIWGNWSRLNETSFATMLRETVKMMSDQEIFGDEPMIYQALEKFLESNDKTVILQTVAEISTLLASFEANITSNIFSTVWGNWSGLNETSYTNMMREAVQLLSDQKLFGDDPMIYQALEQFVASSDKRVVLQKVSEITALLASNEANITSINIFSTIWGNWSRLNETSFANMMKECVKLLSDQQIFGDKPMIYQTLEQFLEFNDKRVILQTLAEISTWLASEQTANITSDQFLSMMLGNWSRLNETSFTNMINEALEQLLASNRTSLIAQKGEEMSVWLTSIGANITSDIIFSVMWSDLSGLTETHLTDMTKEAVKLMSDLQIFGDQPMIYQELDQFLASSNTSLMVNKIVEFLAWLSISEANSSSDIYSMLWGEFSTLNETISSNMMWEAVKLIRDLHIFGDTPMIYQILGSNDTSYVVQKMTEMSVWLVSTEASGLDLLTQALPKMHDIVKPLFSVMKQMSVDMQGDVELIEELAENVLTMLKLLGSNSGLPLPMDQYQDVFQQDIIVSNYTTLQQRREGLLISPLMRDPMDDFTDLFFVNYPAMFEAISVPPTTDDFMETVHMFFNNPNLNVVLKGASVDIPWGLNASREETIDAALGMLSSLTLLDTAQKPFMSNLANAVDLLPDGFPFSSLLKNFTRALANEYQENLNLTDQIFQTVSKFPQMNVTDPQFTEQLDILRAQVCALEGTESVRLLMLSLSMEPGQLCYTFLPSLEILLQSVVMNMTSLTESIFQAFIGDPSTYNIQPTWASVLTESWGVNISSLSNSLNINISSPEKVTISELLRNETAFVMDVQQRMNCDPAFLSLLMNATLPDKNVEILSWLVNLRHCGSTPDTSDIILQTFCSMSVEQWYTFSLLMARHINIDNVFYRVVLSEELQSILEVMLGMAKALADMMDRILPAISQLQNFMMSFQDLNLVANNEFKQMTRGRRSISSQATFATLSRALCSNSIKSLFDITQPTLSTESSYFTAQEREDLMDRFNIPRNATPFCENLYLDMVNTAQGAVAWAFLKPMLMGQILYTPDTPVTRAIMEKANATLQEFANLRKNSENWIKASDYIFESSAQLSSTLPMLQNSLGNSFVKNFIEMHTDISVDKMKETLSSFSNMTLMLERNRYMVKQITTLSSLMVNLSSCVTFDRYRGFDSADELNSKAQELAKKRDLYASVIFKLPNNQNSSTSRPSRSLSTSSLPPRVSYTIRMHMDNVMRTDRVRDPYFVKDTYIFARRTMRYNRGFLYLQESIDRAIIETQVGQRVTEPAVQLQPFPYPCFQRDEYLQAMSYVFPVMLMIAWVLFVADFVRKLVHERELRLHEYMKMMGVNPLSHFFAWFLECAAHLLITTFILTLILKYGQILPNSDGFLLFLYLCDYGLSILAFSYLVSSFFDKTYIAGLSGSLLYILCFFPYIMVIALETNLTVYQKSALSLFAPTCFSYASQYVSRYESQGEGIYWSNAYTSPIVGDTASFGWLCWLMFIDSILYFIIGAYIRMVFPGQYGIPAPWYFPFTASFWSNLCCSAKSENKVGKGLLITNIMQRGHSIFDDDDKGKGQSTVSTQAGEDYSQLPVGVSLHGLSKLYGNRAAIENLNVSFYEGHVTSLLGHNGAGKTTTMSLLTGLFPPSSGAIEVYGRDMQANIDDVRKELGVCMQYDVLFDHLTTKEHLLLYGQIKAPHWSPGELREQVRSILEETGMYAHRHKLVGTLSGGMKRKLSISIAFIGGSRLVVLDEPTTGVDPCSRRSIWDIVIQNKKHRTIIMSTHHLDEAEVLSDRIAFLERGGLKCCGSPFYLKDKLGQGYKLTLTKKPQMQNIESEPTDNAELKTFVQAHMPEARLKDTQGSDLVYSLPPFTSSNASSYRSLLTALDSNLDALQLGGYGISDTTLEEVFLQLTRESVEAEGGALSVSETLSDTASIDSFSSDLSDSISNISDRIKLTGSSMVRGMGLAWQQMSAMLIKRFHHSRRDWKGLIAQILLPVLFMVFAMCLGSIKSNLKSYPDLELSPALYKFGPSYSFFRNLNPNSSQLVDAMTSFPGIDNACLDNSDNPVCKRSTNYWTSSGDTSKPFKICKCTRKEQFCDGDSSQIPHKQIPSSQILYNLSGFNVETYLIATANDFIRNRYGGFDFGLPLPADLQMDLQPVPKNRTLSKIWYNPEGYHTMPAYLNSLSNFILRSSLPADKDPREYAISVSSHPYFGREDDDDIVIQGMLQILVAVCVLTGYSITVTSFAIYEVKEHHSGSKRLQHIAGISEPFYWTVNFFYDMLVYMIPVTLTLGVIAAFQIPAFTDRLNLGAIALLLVLFGFATFPWMYLLSDVFKDAEMAFITYVCINLFISVNTIMSTSILYFLSQLTMRNPEAIKDLFNKLSQAFLIFPQFNFGNGLMELARMNIQVQILSGYGIDAYKNPFSTDCLGWMFISSFIQGVVFFTLRLLLNKSLIRKVRHLVCAKKAVPSIPTEDEDDDVATEHLRVSSGAASSDILQVNKLTKVYEHLRKKVFAVKRVSVGIPAGECFGLLGVNGAGKTTTFKMLTGDVSPTEGTAQIKDWDGRLVDIMECRSKGINIGYCPQVDALDSLLTGEEHLYFYARIRGISKKEIEGVVNYLLKRLELNYHRKIISDSYSCGTRRKLSTALALIGHPQILLLDEPSSGMDPRTKRHLWRIISEEVKGKCAVVLTSHSMEECEALCSRLAIMVKGQFRCLGSLQHIKNRFGSGFTVKMYLAKTSCDAAAITGFMQRQFPSTYLKDQHSNMVEYHIPNAPGGVADIFDQLESNKNALQIKHFSVSQTTLDEVFINFATEKIGMESISVQSEDESEDLDSIKDVEK